MVTVEPPIGLVAELTHRCPQRCPYCSNPLELERKGVELSTDTWERVLREADELGVMQVHLSGGEPTVRDDLERLVRAARKVDLYTNLVTSGVLLDRARLEKLVDAGLDHVQLSVQGVAEEDADRLAGMRGAHARKLQLARWVRELGLPLTLNVVLHRQNVAEIPRFLALALELGASRIELAHTQYYGWALRNRAALMPSREQVREASRLVARENSRLEGRLQVDYVVPDYFARRPKPCMGGWGQSLLVVTPSGSVLPCHAARSIAGLTFENVGERSLGDIWTRSEAFGKFRGTHWMPEPCRGCDRRELDWGGCRCQAHALTGDAANADPACALSPHHPRLRALAEQPESPAAPELVYRGFSGRD